jgi:hypothetical protein
MRFKNLVFVYALALLFASCNGNKGKAPDSTGQGSEILVVCEKAEWNGPLGDTVRAAFMHYMDGLSVPEPEFTLINVTDKDFAKSLQTHRNILVVDIKADNKKSRVETLIDVWSHPQRVVKIKAGSDTAFLNVFARHREAVRELFNQNERARYRIQNALSQNFEVQKLLSDELGIQITISTDFVLAKKTKDFVWLRSEIKNNSLGLLVYTYPYKDTAQVNPAAVIGVRDNYGKLCASGPLMGFIVDLGRGDFQPVSHKMIFREMLAVKTWGLWKAEGDSLGGPFVNYTIVDAPRQRIIVLDGYVYGPDKPKRDYVRQLESIIWGAEFGAPGKF